MKNYKLIVIVFLCALSIALNCQNVESAIGKTSVPKILSNESIEASTYFGSDDAFLAVVFTYSNKREDVKSSGRKLIIYKNQNSESEKIYELDAGLDYFVGMFPLGENSNNLITIWLGGSAYRYKIFNISAGKVSLVLESGSHNFLEIVDLDNDGRAEILISEGAFLKDVKDGKVISYPEKTEVYKWNGKSYLLFKTVPWKSRLGVLKKETK